NLCRTYWRPMYSFVRRKGTKPEEAKDLTQGFFALILGRKDFQSVRQEKGRLRSFLLASLKHFMANERRDASTIKRGGGRTPIPLDWIGSDDSGDFDRSDMLSADLLYDRRWAFTVLDRVFARLREGSQRSANAPLLERLTRCSLTNRIARRKRRLRASLAWPRTRSNKLSIDCDSVTASCCARKSRTRWQPRPRLKTNCATSSLHCARNLLRISVQYLKEGNARAV